jgi:creatinine amidohydrolase
MQLQLQTWEEVEAYLQTSRGIILPIGSTEQHGPIGLIGTDAICAEVIARASAKPPGPSSHQRSRSAWLSTISALPAR